MRSRYVQAAAALAMAIVVAVPAAAQEATTGKPLRDLLRAGLIVGAYQDSSRRWHIPSSLRRRG